jgi:hypothetical protein
MLLASNGGSCRGLGLRLLTPPFFIYLTSALAAKLFDKGL